ncbi:hypothetical protein RND71_012783 [Anisodus tanguticus]|uniref:TCP domain-containing protein n=1 Tax=Anisodus tanguticus TaxID=243964 RepID=A0AAE1SHR4_9SOLA|nr:hypothetical protein RND71_012783 [Anisodus tanguticus]
MKRTTEGGGVGGEIVQVEGGHILRSNSRKDRHSKVYTAKGPRDRRVRLSAHTAIQFYDVQDKLGYDRPSKAVDWLIKKAKDAIDKLDELPPWNPTNHDPSTTEADIAAFEQQPEYQLQRELEENNPSHANSSNSYMMQAPTGGEAQQSLGDTMKSFFPMNSGTSLMNFQNYPHEIMPRSSIQNEDLGLSLHTTFHRASSSHDNQSALFSNQNFEANYPRMASWNILPHHQPQTFFTQSGTFSQREPLQSNFSHLINHHASWEERPIINGLVHHQAEISNNSRHFTTDFQVPARIHGEHHEDPSSASPNSHHH